MNGLARQGAIYVRLTKKFNAARNISNSNEEIILSDDDDFENPPACQRPKTNTPYLLPVLETSTHSIVDGDQLPEVPLSKSSLVAKQDTVSSDSSPSCSAIPANSYVKIDIAHMFPQLSETATDALLELNDGSTVAAIELLLNPPGLEEILDMLKAQLQIEGNVTARLHMMSVMKRRCYSRSWNFTNHLALTQSKTSKYDFFTSQVWMWVM